MIEIQFLKQLNINVFDNNIKELRKYLNFYRDLNRFYVCKIVFVIMIFNCVCGGVVKCFMIVFKMS